MAGMPLNLILLLTLHQCFVINAMQGYILTGPKSLMPESVETFCVSIEGGHVAANCTLDLLATEDDSVYASTTHWVEGPKDCVKLSVPAVSEFGARLRWRMEFEGLPDYKIDTIKEVGLRQKNEAIHLIQTDKVWYTPGQLVRFRIMSLNHLLQPLLDTIKRVWVEDPAGITISQWTNLTTRHGIHQLELQLSSEPLQGLWRVRTDKFSKDFEVREYVLPKFEVILNTPSFLHYNADDESGVQKINIDICGKYSYGQPVRGTWKTVIQVASTGRYYSRRNQPPTPPINFERKGVLNSDTGCHSLKLSGDQLGISTYDGSIDKNVKVIAFVVEQGTNIEMNTTWSTEVKRQMLVLDIVSWSSNVFKNGLPYYGKLKVSTAGGQSAAGIKVEICAHPNYENRVVADSLGDPDKKRPRTPPKKRPNTRNAQKYCTLRVTDENGFIGFELLPSEPEIIEYAIKATISRTALKQKRSILSHLVAASPQPDVVVEKQFTIRSIYSPTESFLAFVPPPNYPNPIHCLSKLPIKLYFTADKEINFNLHYIIMARGDVVLTGVRQVKFREEDNVDLGLGETLLNKRGDLDSEVEASLKTVGDVEFEIDINPEFAPKISILAYYVREDREVVTASITIPIENCFPNPVKLSWSSRRKQPGQNVTMNLKSSPGSICGYSVVDRSVTFARPDLQLTEANIFSALPSLHLEAGSGPSQVTSQWEYCAKKTTESKSTDGTWMDLRRRKRSFFPWHYDSQYRDAMEAFDNAGLLVMSDLNIETRPCSDRSYYHRSIPRSRKLGGNVEPRLFRRPVPMAARFEPEMDDGAQMLRMRQARPISLASVGEKMEEPSYENEAVDLTSAVTIRTYFPETWLWDLVTLNSQGELKKTVELPHTVTTWVGRALCVSESEGFGMSSAENVEAFQPFFLELHLPYSAKRTEKLQIKVSVFNYAPHSLPVRLTFPYSEQLELISEKDSVSFCIAPRSNIVHHFLVHVTELGTHNVTIEAAVDENYPQQCGPEYLPSGKDSVIKELLVKPEGFPIERSYSHMACPKDFEEDKNLVWDLSLPDDLVEGSARAWVTAVGDLMGPALQGLSGLVRLPMGCGEQNMILFTPNIYVIQYLEATSQLETAFKSKAIGFMKSGYQRELTYRHNDGSYSAFGKNDPEGSLWLTAFVVKSFAAARRYIHVDDNELQTSVRWLLSKQQENGCFPVVGTVLHKDLKGGLSESEDLAPLTAFTLISLLEMHPKDGNTNSEQLINKILVNTLPCLEPEEGDLPDPYTKALTAYALVLAGRNDSARSMIDWLMTHAQRNNSLLWWQKLGSGPALSVEMSSYVLLSLVKMGGTENLLNARSIVRWLSKQRNSEGGFVSTQDTVVALQAIAAYASLIGAQPVDMELLVDAGEFEYSIRIREQDRLVQRRIDLPLPLPSQVQIFSVSEGSGCTIVQSILRYNVYTPPPSAAFELNVTNVEEKEGVKCGPQRLTVCVRYASPQQASNMALLEIGLVSGYETNKSSLESMTRNESFGIKRMETKGDVVIFYFDQISEDICISLVAHPAFEVNDVKDANVKIYDYYQPEHTVSVSYSLPNACLPPVIETELLPLPEENISSDKSAEAVVDVGEVSKELEMAVAPQPLIIQPTQRMQADEQRTFVRPSQFRLGSKIDLGSEDLETPDGVEGPAPVYASFGQSQGCPKCLLEVPKNFPTLYCEAVLVFGAETRPSRGNRLRLTYDMSRQHEKLIRTNATVDLLMDPKCHCSLFDKDMGNRSVTVLGLPLTPLPAPPAKLLVGPQLLIIDKNANQLKIKSVRSKCSQG